MNIYSNWNIGDTAYAVETYKDSVSIIKVKVVGFIVTDEVKVRVVSDDGALVGTVSEEMLFTYWYMAADGARKALGVDDSFAPRPRARDFAAAAEAAGAQGATTTAEEPF